MYTESIILLIILAVIILLILYGHHLVSYSKELKESFTTSFSQGSESLIKGEAYDYYYQFLPSVANDMMEYINKELDSASNQKTDKAIESTRTFDVALKNDKSVTTKYMGDRGTVQNVIMPSTKLAIFLDIESYFDMNVQFPSDQYTKTASGMSRADFVTSLIRKYFQNFMTVNALDAYRAGVMPVYSIISSTRTQDDDTLVAEASVVLEMVRKAQSLMSADIKEDIPQFTLSRVYASVQDRLEAKAALLFRLLSDVDITNDNTLKANTSLDKNSISDTTKVAKKNKVQALEQTKSYQDPFLVCLLRSVIETARVAPAPSVRYNSTGQLIQFASRTGVSSANVSNYEVENVNTLGSGYTPNTLVLLGDTETAMYKERLRNVIAIMMKKLQAQEGAQTMCSTSNMTPSKQHCTTFTPSSEDSSLAEELVYYLFGFYKKATTKDMIAKEIGDLKSLSQNDTTKLSEDYIKAGFFTTDELIMLNNTDHRLHFIGPYTSCLRLLLSKVTGISGNATLREDLMLLNNER